MKKGPKFESGTTYKQNYDEKELPRQDQFEPESPVDAAPRGKFQGESAYKGEYKQWELEKPERYEQEAYKKPTQKVQGKSSY